MLTPKIASYYEEYYKSRGVNFVKGTVLSSFDFDDNGKVHQFFLLEIYPLGIFGRIRRRPVEAVP